MGRESVPADEWRLGDITLSRTTSNVKADYVSIAIRVDGERIDVEMDLATLAKC